MTDQRGPQLMDNDHVERLPFDMAVPDADATMTVTLIRRVTPGAPATVVAVRGDIDRAGTPLLDHALSQALRDPLPVCCELSGVHFFGAAAANSILAAYVGATYSGRVFVLCGVRGMTARVLSLVDPDGVVPRQAQPAL
jgi:anti-anti-sigma factor